MSQSRFEHIKKMREEKARQIKAYCKSQFPNCRECDHGEQISERIVRCKVQGKPKDWEIY